MEAMLQMAFSKSDGPCTMLIKLASQVNSQPADIIGRQF
jgi:hypothetical protein